jgi:hypothetical protein
MKAKSIIRKIFDIEPIKREPERIIIREGKLRQ